MPRGKFFLSILICLTSAAIQAQDLTYHRDIKPILERNCVNCHQRGDVGPMPLTTYEDVSAYGKMIQFVTSSRLMPPWYADPSYRHFANERILSEEEIKKISDWVVNQMPEGEPGLVPFDAKKDSGSITREPDLIIPMQQGFEQFGIYLDQYQVFILPTNLPEDKWIDRIEFVPGNKKIVRFAAISVESSDKFDTYDSWDPRSGYYSFGGLGLVPEQPNWYTWSPQQATMEFPKGAAKFLSKGSKLILHVHYGPTGIPQKDSSVVKLYFAPGKIEKSVITAPLINPYSLTADSLFIAANTKKIFHASYTLPYNIDILSLTPQANLICRSWEVFAMIPGDPDAIKLLKINDWNFNWKQTYYFNSPVSLPKGTVIHALAHYDNTANNPCNPLDPPDPIHWKPHTLGELFFVHFEFLSTSFSNRSIQFIAPVTESDSIMPIVINVETKGEYSLLVCTTTGTDCRTIKPFSLHAGHNAVNVPVADIAEGNYLLRITDIEQTVRAEQLFIKMRENGL